MQARNEDSLNRAANREKDVPLKPDPKTDEGVQAGEDRDPTQPLGKRVVKGGVLLEVRHLTALTKQGQALFQDVSLYVQPGEVVAVTGADQEAISALVEALAGVRRPSEGEVRIDGVELYPNLRVFRPRIGYVPSANPVQPSLTVAEALRTAARFRLPRGTAREKQLHQVEAVLAGLALSAYRDQRIGKLPVAERLRTSLGLELGRRSQAAGRSGTGRSQ